MGALSRVSTVCVHVMDTAVFQYLREQRSVVLLGLAATDTQLFEGLRRVFPSVERVWSEKPTANHEQDLCVCVCA